MGARSPGVCESVESFEVHLLEEEAGTDHLPLVQVPASRVVANVRLIAFSNKSTRASAQVIPQTVSEVIAQAIAIVSSWDRSRRLLASIAQVVRSLRLCGGVRASIVTQQFRKKQLVGVECLWVGTGLC